MLLQKASPFNKRNRATIAKSINVTDLSFQLLVKRVLKISVDGLRKLEMILNVLSIEVDEEWATFKRMTPYSR